MSRRCVLSPILLAVLFASVSSRAGADPVQFPTRAAFLAVATNTITDDYSNAGYKAGDAGNGSDVDVHSDTHMSAVLGETIYRSTGHPNNNVITDQGGASIYCAGCNGSFLLTFTSTSVGTADGVGAVAFDLLNLSPRELYGAMVTFGNGRQVSYRLPPTSQEFRTLAFWGIAAPELIRSIHFGFAGGTETTQSGAFAIDNLTIASAAPVPEPATLLLISTGCAAVAVRRRRHQRRGASAPQAR